MFARPAAILVCSLLAGLALFQFALALGAPWGRLAWGGAHERLPAALRIGSLVSIAIYVVFAIILLERAGMIATLPSPDIARIGSWAIAGYLAIGIIMNAVSRSRPEQLVMTPLALVLCSASVVVAMDW